MQKNQKTTVLTVFLVLSIALLATVPAMALAAGSETGNKTQESDGKESGEEAVSGEGPEMGQGSPGYEECMKRAEGASMFGTFSASDAAMSGKFVSFEYNASLGTISGYSLKVDGVDIPVFEALDLGIALDDIDATGAVFSADIGNYKIRIHNNPQGTLQISSPSSGTEVNISLMLAPGLGIGARSNGTSEITGLSIPAYLNIGSAGMSVSGSALTVSLGSGGHLMFMAIPSQGGSGQSQEYAKAVMNGSVDSELQVVSSSGSQLGQTFQYQGEVQMTVKTRESNKLKVGISSEEHAGKCVAVVIDKDALKVQSRDQICVKMDGNGMDKADSVQGVMDGKSQKAAYCIEDCGSYYRAMVYVPGFSEHELSIEETSSANEGVSSTVIGIAILLAALSIIAVGSVLYYLFSNKNRKN